MMVFQPSYDATHDHDAHDDRLRSNQRSRLDRMFSRRAQKAATYRRVLVTTQSRFLGFGRQAV